LTGDLIPNGIQVVTSAMIQRWIAISDRGKHVCYWGVVLQNYFGTSETKHSFARHGLGVIMSRPLFFLDSNVAQQASTPEFCNTFGCKVDIEKL
jgi:hypothetical protein